MAQGLVRVTVKPSPEGLGVRVRTPAGPGLDGARTGADDTADAPGETDAEEDEPWVGDPLSPKVEAAGRKVNARYCEQYDRHAAVDRLPRRKAQTA